MVDDRYTSDDVRDEIDDDSGSSFFSNTGALPLGLPSRAGDEQRPDQYGDQPHDRARGQATADETSAGQTGGSTDGSFAEEGLATLLIVAGVVLFLIPEPATSALGMLLVATGAVLWLVDWLA